MSAGTKLVERIGRQDFTPDERGPVSCADDVLGLLVEFATADGYYFGSSRLIARLYWWQDYDKEQTEAWIAELIERGDIAIEPLGQSLFSDAPVLVSTILNKRKFSRWDRRRPHISLPLRRAVYNRDGWRCVTCGTGQDLSLDHIKPYSKGGLDTFENFQTLCRSCNSKKGARV